MVTALIPGSFDPLTNGHKDIIERASLIFESVTVGIIVNPHKTGDFSIEQREGFIRHTFADNPRISVVSFSGLLSEFVSRQGYTAIIKGLRTPADFTYELAMDHMNYQLAQVNTLYLSTAAQWSFVSSSLVKEVAKLGGDVSPFVPPVVFEALQAAWNGKDT